MHTSIKSQHVRMFACVLVVVAGTFLLTKHVATAQKGTTTYYQALRIGRGILTSLAWNPSNQFVAAGGDLGVWIYDSQLHDIKLLEDFAPIGDIVWSPDGKRLAASSSTYSTVVIWETDKWQAERIATPKGKEITALAWSKDGTRIAVATGSTGEIDLWDIASLSQPSLSIIHGSRVRGLSWRMKDSQIVSVSGFTPGAFELDLSTWDARTGSQLTHLQTGDSLSNSATMVSLTPQPKSASNTGAAETGNILLTPFALWLAGLAVATIACLVGLGIVSRRQMRPLIKGLIMLGLGVAMLIVVATACVSVLLGELGAGGFPSQGDISSVSVVFSPTGDRVAIGGWFGVVQVRDVATGREIARLDDQLGDTTALAWSANGSQLAVGTRDSVLLWDLKSAKTTLKDSDGRFLATQVAWGPNDSSVAAVFWQCKGDNLHVMTWDTRSGQQLATNNLHQRYVLAIGWNPKGDRLAENIGEETIIYDAFSGISLRTLDTSSASDLAWSPDGKRIAVVTYDHIDLWDMATGQLVRSLQGHQSYQRMAGLAWSPSGQQIAGGVGNDILVWNVTSGAIVRTLTGHSRTVNSISWSSDSQHLASGDDNGQIRIWEVATGSSVLEFHAHDAPVNTVVWRPDGRELASAGNDDTIRVWDAANGTSLLAIQAKRTIPSIDWNPDGSQLVGANCDSGNNPSPVQTEVCIWNASTGTLEAALVGHIYNVLTVRWSPVGDRLASGGTDGTLRIWQGTVLI